MHVPLTNCTSRAPVPLRSLAKRALPPLALVGLLAAAGEPLRAEDRDWPAFRVGQWVDAWGSLEHGEMHARRLRLRGPRSHHVLRGVAEPALRAGASFALLGIEVETNDETEWRGVAPQELPGAAVRVDGDFYSERRFVALRVSARKSEEPALSARIDTLHRHPERLTLRALGRTIVVDARTRLEIESSPADIRRTPSRPSGGDGAYFGRDEDDILGDGIELRDDLRLAMQHQLTASSRAALRADLQDDEGRDDSNYLFRGRLAWQPSWRLLGVTEVGVEERRRDDFRGPTSESRLRLREAFLLAHDIGWGLDLQAGRQDFDEPREWLYDQSLDGLRLVRRRSGLNLELSLSRTTPDVRLSEESTNAVFYLSNLDPRRHLAAYWLHRDFDRNGAKRNYLGVRALGSWLVEGRSWLELSYLRGETRGRAIEALGGDAGAVHRFGHERRWALIGGYAWGQGGRSADGTDHTFRQTGLHDNDAPMAGVTSYRYYGELLNPELANLHIATLGLGVRLPMRSSLELVAHTYRLDHPRRSLVDADIDDRLDGRSRDLGWEVDLIGGLAGVRNWRFEVVGAIFERGDAFPDRSSASLLRIQARYRQ